MASSRVGKEEGLVKNPDLVWGAWRWKQANWALQGWFLEVLHSETGRCSEFSQERTFSRNSSMGQIITIIGKPALQSACLLLCMPTYYLYSFLIHAIWNLSRWYLAIHLPWSRNKPSINSGSVPHHCRLWRSTTGTPEATMKHQVFTILSGKVPHCLPNSLYICTTASPSALNYIHIAHLHSELQRTVSIEENKIWCPCTEYHQSNPCVTRVHQ